MSTKQKGLSIETLSAEKDQLKAELEALKRERVLWRDSQDSRSKRRRTPLHAPKDAIKNRQKKQEQIGKAAAKVFNKT